LSAGGSSLIQQNKKPQVKNLIGREKKFLYSSAIVTSAMALFRTSPEKNEI
jgi:hypothetical protein